MTDANQPDRGRSRALALLGVGVVIVAIALVFMAVTTVMAETTTTSSDPVQADEIVIDLRAPGTFEVIATDDTEVTVEVTVRDPFGWVSEDERLEGSSLILESSCAGRWIWFLDRCRVDYVVRAPASTEISGSIRNGEIEAEGLRADVNLSTNNGSIVLDDIEGTVQLESDNGELQISGVTGEMTLATSNGEIRVFDSIAPGMVQASSDNGEIQVSNTSGDLDLETSNGSIDVDNTDATVVDARSDNGRITLMLASAPEQITAVTGNGRIEIVLPSDAPAYAVDVSTDNGSTDTGGLVIDPASPFTIDATSDNGSISISTR